MPNRDGLARHRLFGPMFAPLVARGQLWRFTRRTVPRGVAVGLFVGIFVMVPGLQVVGAVLLCVPLRANIPVAAASTFVAIPPTIVFMILPAAAMIGNRFGYHADLAAITAMIDRGASRAEWLAWIGSDAAPALGLGLIVLAVIMSVLGHVVAARLWRWRVAVRRRQRLHTGRARISGQ
ncbi:DUF2062 domain-containing protein [Novosphingobium sp.]|uniref:DUF2062 domain-containing protein n=1 Tax=Novosphingobium sp. TaxID=1874826 RepID=UPI00333F9F99